MPNTQKTFPRGFCNTAIQLRAETHREEEHGKWGRVFCFGSMTSRLCTASDHGCEKGRRLVCLQQGFLAVAGGTEKRQKLKVADQNCVA